MDYIVHGIAKSQTQLSDFHKCNEELLALTMHPRGLARWLSRWKNLPAVQKSQETWVRSLDEEDPLEEGMATHSSILAWRLPWTEEPGGYSPRGLKNRTRLKGQSTAHSTCVTGWIQITNHKKMKRQIMLSIANFQKEIELSCGHAYLQKCGQHNNPLSRSTLEAKLHVEVCWSRTESLMIQIFIGVWHERPRLARGPAVTESLAGKSSALDGASAGSAKARLFSACLYAHPLLKQCSARGTSLRGALDPSYTLTWLCCSTIDVLCMLMLTISESNFISNLFVQPLVCPLYLQVLIGSY